MEGALSRRILGADVVIDYTRQAFVKSIEEVDVVLDTVGGDVLRDAFQVVKRGGSIVSLPGQKGVQALGDELAPKSGVAFAAILVHPSGSQMAELAKLADAGQLKTHLDAVFPLQDVAQAHTLIEGRHVRGKLVLTLE
jgi:NADPH:quinone reductase-like Zn-dependent oxidoreductase